MTSATGPVGLADESRVESVPAPASRVQRRAERAIWLLLALLVVVGMAGLDQAFYEGVSLRLNTAHPIDLDFYTLTRPVWFVIRTAFAHVAGAAVAYALVVALHRERWRAANRLLLTIVAGALLAFVLEGLIGRVRPNLAGGQLAFAPLDALIHWRSRAVCFPSGEATMAFAMAVALASLFPGWRVAFYTLATLASVARLVNGAHFLGDVAGGALLGLLAGRAVYAYLSTSGPRMLRACQSP